MKGKREQQTSRVSNSVISSTWLFAQSLSLLTVNYYRSHPTPGTLTWSKGHILSCAYLMWLWWFNFQYQQLALLNPHPLPRKRRAYFLKTTNQGETMTLTVQELIIKLDEFADNDTIQVGSMGTLFEISNISKQDGANNVVIEFEPHSDLVIDTSEEESEDEESEESEE